MLVIGAFPILATSAVLDWDANNWPLPSLAESYNVGGSNINIGISGNTGQLNTTGNPASPETNQHLNGGTTNEDALFIRTDFVATNEDITITINFTHPGGVSDLSFTFWDVDADIPQWNDEIRVNAIANGVTVNPSSVSDGVTNSPIGANGTIGDPADNNNAGNASADGNVTFTFNQTRITQVTIVYSNATTGTPGNQWISLHDITFDIAPTITKSFSPDAMTSGDVSTLTIDLDNNDTSAATLSADLVDNLPAGVTVASPANIGGSCPGTVNAPVGGGTITYTNGSTIPAGGCAITVDVTSSTVGTVTNTIAADALQTNLGNNAASASDDLTISAVVAPTVNKSFSPDSIGLNGISTLTITLDNTNTYAATLNTALVDTLPTAGNGDVVIAATPNIGGTCNSADVTAAAGAALITFANNESIPVGGCTIIVDVTSATVGTYINTIAAGALQTDLGNNAVAASDSLTVNATTPPTVAKSFNPSTITAGSTSQLTIALGNVNASAITLAANMDDNLPTGVTITAVNGSTTCSAGSVDISVNTRVRYQSGATIPSGGCNIVVNVTSNTLGTVTNTIAAGALITDAGSNANPASGNITVNAGGGGIPTCPAGTTLINQTGNADAVVAGNPFNPNEALGAIMLVGSPTNDANSARLINSRPTMTLDLTDTVPENSTLILSIARNNNGGNYDIDSSTNVGGPFSSVINFSAGPNDISQQISYTVPSGGARYVRFTRNSGSLWVDGVQYSQICQTPPTADLSITKDDSSLTYTPGGTATYTIVVTNNGPDDVTGATIADDLPNGVTMTSAWTCIPSSASSSCNTAPSTSDPISIDVDIINGDTITITVPVQFSANMSDY